MDIAGIAKRLVKLAGDNSPLILTAIGAAGVLTTAYLTGKASFKAAQVLDDYETDAIRTSTLKPLETKDKVALTWKMYIPAASSAVCTIVCVILANRIGTKRAAALAAAYALSERAYEEYRDKVVEKLGAKKEQAARDEIAQERVNRNPPDSSIVFAGEGTVLCMEAFTGRYFLSDIENLKKAQNDLNFRILHDYYASLTEFYTLIDLPKTSMSDDFGWNSDKPLELQFSATLTETGRPCMVIDYAVTPIRDFYKGH